MWFILTIIASGAGVIRLVAQKKSSSIMNVSENVSARFIFGLPLCLLIFLILLYSNNFIIFSVRDYILLGLAAVLQIAATLCFSLILISRNFFVSVSFPRTSALQAAILGFIFLGYKMTTLEFCSVLMGVMGIFLFAIEKKADQSFLTVLHRMFFSSDVLLGTMSGTFFATSALSLRNVMSHHFNNVNHYALGLQITILVYVLQAFLMIIFLFLYNKSSFRKLAENWKVASSSGLFAIFGTSFSYIAFTYINPAFVLAVSQVNIVMLFFITFFIFKEKVRLFEIIGATVVTISVLLLAVTKM